jgi:hypothetical protein
MGLVETEDGYIIDEATGLVFDEYGDPVVLEGGVQAHLYFDGEQWQPAEAASEPAYEDQPGVPEQHLEAALAAIEMVEAKRGVPFTNRELRNVATDLASGRTAPSGTVIDSATLDLDDRNQRREYMTERMRDVSAERKSEEQDKEWASGVINEDWETPES